MSEQNPTGAPRPERGPVTELVRLFLVQLAAVIGIATAIVVIVALVGPDGDDDVTAATPTRSSSHTGTKETPAPSTASSAPAPSTPSSSAPAPSPSTSSPTDTGVPAPVEVDVLNQSAPGGSAEQVAQRLADAGWQIGRVDDFHGNVSTTTVYWLDLEQRRQARQISRFLGGVRVQEGFDTLVDGRVSVVLVEAP